MSDLLNEFNEVEARGVAAGNSFNPFNPLTNHP
jgi:hypothetical protein